MTQTSLAPTTHAEPPGGDSGRKGTGSAKEVTLQWAEQSWSRWARWWIWSHGINHFEGRTCSFFFFPCHWLDSSLTSSLPWIGYHPDHSVAEGKWRKEVNKARKGEPLAFYKVLPLLTWYPRIPVAIWVSKEEMKWWGHYVYSMRNSLKIQAFPLWKDIQKSGFRHMSKL